MLNKRLLNELFIRDPYALIVKDGKATAVRGILVDVYKNSNGDCTNGGTSSHHDQLLVPCGDGPFKASVNDDTVVVFREKNGYKYLEPLSAPDHGDWMMGGNFAMTSDSRFIEHFNAYPLPIHDRQE